MKFFCAYCSPAGSTRHVAGIVGQELQQLGCGLTYLDLGKTRDWRPFIDKITSAAAADGTCLFIGSPVYVFHVVPPVIQFIELLPSVLAGAAVPFVTWGFVTSGIALWEMGKMLIEKGFGIAAAAKVLSVHSRLWQSQQPIGVGHPDKADDAVVIELVRKFFNNIVSGHARSLSLAQLDYQSHDHREMMMRTSVQSDPRKIPPRKVREDKCTQCGDCQAGCPADAIRLAPYPVFGEACFGCFNCVRLCPAVSGKSHRNRSFRQKSRFVKIDGCLQ
ncbi:MAG: 4Fe-4S binding protein [Desulfobacterales bacterium]|nr:4Fe-4S binding protein [Desulfobacterales bacterium]